MRFDIYDRTDGLRLVVPAVLPTPAALATEGPLVRVGSVALAFSTLSADLSYAIALSGFGVASDVDDAMIDVAMLRPDATRPAGATLQ